MFGAASAAVALSNLAMYGTLLAVPVVLAGRPDWSAADAGFALAMLSVAMIAVAPFGGRIADRRGHRLPAAAGLALLTLSTALLAAIGPAPAAAGLVCALLLGGIGLGLANAAVQTAAIEAVAPRHAGVAAGLFATARYSGAIVAALLLAGLLGGGGEHAQAFFAVAALSAGGSALLALRLGGPRRLVVSASPPRRKVRRIAETVRNPLFARLWARLSEHESSEQVEHRREMLAGLSGRVIELGAGTGQQLRALSAHRPRGRRDRARAVPARVRRAGREPAHPCRSTSATRSPARCPRTTRAATPPSPASCCAACPIRRAALAELRRVLRPGGELRFYEHVHAERQPLRAVLSFADASRLWPRLAGGCHAARDTLRAIEAAGFSVSDVRRFDFSPGRPVPGVPHILGRAMLTARDDRRAPQLRGRATASRSCAWRRSRATSRSSRRRCSGWSTSTRSSSASRAGPTSRCRSAR